MARDSDTHRELSRQFQDREVEKKYIAEVGGVVDQENGFIDIPIRKDMEHPPMQCVDYEQGKSSQTHWRITSRKENSTLLELRPTTGRSHQLRIHLREIGHPILGDALYAPQEVFAMSSRLMLHSHTLTITHPGTGERATFTANCSF